jgi:hypothetical protein
VNLDNSLRVHPQRPMVLREALPDFGLDNFLNRGDITILIDSTESLTAFGTTFLVDLHTTRLARSALSH